MQPKSAASPFEPILSDIKNALDAKLYYLAIAVSLSLPDICSCLSQEPGRVWAKQDKYEAWCTENLIPPFQHLTAHDVYRLRCGVLHQGNFGRPDDHFDRIIFSIPESGWTVHDVFVQAQSSQGDEHARMAVELMFKAQSYRTGGIEVRPGEKALILNVILFCQQIMDAASTWYEKNAADSNIAANTPHIVRARLEFPPYFDGISVIA